MKKQYSKVRSTRRSLWMSILSLVLCFTMLLGTTWAWFTDEVTSGRNQIKAGNLDVELYHSNGQVTDKKVQDATDLFATDLWEPGKVVYENFTVKNVGTLALKYQLKLSAFDKNATVEGHDLTEVIKVAVVEGGFSGNRAAAQALTGYTSFADFEKTGKLAANTGSDTYGVVLYWAPTDHDNDYNLKNGLKSTDNQPLFVEFGVNLVATQDTVEVDSFDKFYDQYADYPSVAKRVDGKGSTDPMIVNESNNIGSENGSTMIEVKNGLSTTEILASAKVPFNAVNKAPEGKDSSAVQDMQNAVSGLLPMPAVGSGKSVEDKIVLTLNIDTKSVTTESMTMDVSMLGSITRTITDGDTSVSKSAEQNIKELAEPVLVQANIGAKLSKVTVTHSHDGASTPMTAATSLAVLADGQFYYDEVGGDLSVMTSKFSDFIVEYETPYTFHITDEATLNQAIANVKGTKQLSTLIIENSFSVKNTVKIPVDTILMIDMNGKKIEMDFSAAKNVKDLIISEYVPLFFNEGDIFEIKDGTLTTYGIKGTPILNKGNINIVDNMTLSCDTKSDAWCSAGATGLANFSNVKTVKNSTLTSFGRASAVGDATRFATGLYNSPAGTIETIENCEISATSFNGTGLTNRGTIDKIEKTHIVSSDAASLQYNVGFDNTGKVNTLMDSKVETKVTGTFSSADNSNDAITNYGTMKNIVNTEAVPYTNGAKTYGNAIINTSVIENLEGSYFFGSVSGGTTKYINGGYYTMAPKFDFRKENYVVKEVAEEHNGLTYSYQVVEDATAYAAEKQAIIDNSPAIIVRGGQDVIYATLGEAFNDVKKNETIVITKDCKITSIEKNAANGVYTLDLNGHTIESDSYAQQMFSLYYCSLTIVDSSVEQTGKILNNKGDMLCILVSGNATYPASVTLKSGTIEGKFSTGAFYANKYATVNIEGGFVYNTSTRNIFAKGASATDICFNVTGGTLRHDITSGVSYSFMETQLPENNQYGFKSEEIRVSGGTFICKSNPFHVNLGNTARFVVDGYECVKVKAFEDNANLNVWTVKAK